MNILYSAPTTVVKSHIIEVANNFAELGNIVHLVTFWKDKPKLHPAIEWHNASVRNRHWNEFNDVYIRKFGKEYLKNLFRRNNKSRRISLFEVILNHIIDNERIDFIYERHITGSPTTRIGIDKKIPVVLELNGIWPIDARDKGFSASFCKKQLELDLEALSLATCVRTVGTGVRDYYVKHGIEGTKFHIIGNGANPDHFRPLDRVVCRERIGIDKDKKIIGFSGSFQFYVGLEHVIKAMPLVLKEVPEAHLFLMGRRLPKGSGYSDQDILKYARELNVQNNVTIAPECPYSELSYYINAFDVCLVPLTRRRNEIAGCSSLKFHEYLACGKPVVASRINNIQDYRDIENENIVFFFEPENPKDMARQIVHALNSNSQEEKNENGKRARDYVIEHKSWQKIVKQILDLVKESKKGGDE